MKDPNCREKESVFQKISLMRQELSDRFTVRRIGVFGSVINGKATAESDLDILVEFDEPTFDHYMDLKFMLEDNLKCQVDLVMADTIKPRIKSIIEHEVVYA